MRYARAGLSWKIRGDTVLGYAPEEISLELTNSCNFKCAFCPQSDPKHFDHVARTMLDPDAAELMLTRLREGGVKTDVMHWTLDGEPFLNRNFDDICALAVKLGWRHFIFATNGFYCTPARLSTLPRQNGARYVLHVDFCSDEALFEKHRGQAGSWERIRRNILGVANDRALAHISVQLTDISSFAIDDADVLERRFSDLKRIFSGCRGITFKTRTFHNACGHVPELAARKKAANRTYNLCPYPWMSLYVASNGDVVACCRDLRHKTVLGNLITDSLPSIWNGPRYQQMRAVLLARKPESIDACKNCDLPYDANKFALGHMIHIALNRFGMLR
ncbi:radical SAM/SPASM domain-containing protein [Inquilinus sp. Marseille-Q2685]|uniref:radical SAM/SPASM domain-containing protein n=1 Tax=Inquilinus sp. Marseille-Q2685 TaxID=2866581 RepID=UPI001CE47884|nr:radical SAM/SPASM domain-containing protein [Inquilinus sp. Marseille-Q2685]